MTNAAAPIALTYDGTTVQENPIGIFLDLVRGFAEGPSVRGTDTVVPGRTGRIARNRVPDVWRIELRGYVAGDGFDETAGRADFADLRQQMRVLFDPTRDPANLVATLENGDVATITCRPLPTPLWDQIVPAMARVSYELEAVEDWVIVPSGS